MIYLIFAFLVVFVALAVSFLLAPMRLRLILNDRTRTVSLGWPVIQVTRDLRERTFVLYLGGRAIIRIQSRPTEKRQSKIKKTAEDKERKKSKFNLTDLWRERDLAEKIIQAGLRLVWEVLKSVCWDKFSLEVDLSTPDPALTGCLYGELCAVKYSTEFVFPRARIEIRPDFVNQFPRMSAESVLSLRPVSVALPLWRAFFAVPKFRIIKLIILSKRR
jgi:hypothetical protein